MSLLLKSFKTKRGLRRFIGPKRIVVLFVLLLGVIWVWDQYNNGNLSPEIIRHYRIHHPILAVFLFVLVYAVSVIFTLPTLPLNLAAGFFWGGSWVEFIPRWGSRLEGGYHFWSLAF